MPAEHGRCQLQAEDVSYRRTGCTQLLSRNADFSPPTETPYTLMNYFLRCSVFVNWCFHSEEKDVVLEAVLECNVPPS